MVRHTRSLNWAIQRRLSGVQRVESGVQCRSDGLSSVVFARDPRSFQLSVQRHSNIQRRSNIQRCSNIQRLSNIQRCSNIQGRSNRGRNAE